MDQLERLHAKRICHECHKYPNTQDLELFDDLAYADISFDDPDTCPKCLCPDDIMDVVMLFNPLYRCECGRLIMQFASKIFACKECRNIYYHNMLILASTMQSENMEYDQILCLDDLIEEHIVGCDSVNHIEMLDEEKTKEYINEFKEITNTTPNSNYAKLMQR